MECGLVPVKVQPYRATGWWTSCFTCAVGPLVFSLLYMLEYVCVCGVGRLEHCYAVGPLVFLLQA